MPEPYPTLKPWRRSIHAQCLAHGELDGRTVICRKSEGHTDSDDPRRREHFDSDADLRWTDEET